MGEYTKPWLSFEQQADLLITDRGLIADRDDLVGHLADIGYYRLSGYWYIFKRKPKDDENGKKDERFIVKDTPATRALLSATEIPYEGAAEMMLVDIENKGSVTDLVISMLPDLPEPKKRRR